MTPSSLAAGMTLDEQLGQLLVAGFPDPSVTQEIADLVQHHHVGGIILFSRNLQDAAQTLALTQALQALARSAGHRYPLLIALDQENGVVRRLGRGTTSFPGNMALAATGSERLVHDVAQATGRELRALGINWNLAPVADVNNNPANPVIGVRSYGEDPHEVARCVAAAVRGYRAAGILCCLKHFPGHGDTAVDSHVAMPTVPHALERLEQVELVPFEAGMAAGADSVMLGHMALPQLMGQRLLPATLAPEIARGLLRERLGFEGVIASDCLEMGAVADSVGTEQGAVMALQAGIDLVLVSHRDDRQRGALATARAAVESGALEPEVIRQAAERVHRLKAGAFSGDTLPTAPVPAWVGGAEHQRLADQAYEQSVTLVRDDAALLPLHLGTEERLLVLYPLSESLTAAEEEHRYPVGFAVASFARRHPRVDSLGIAARPTANEREQIAARAAQAYVVVIATMNANLHPEQAAVVQRLVQDGRRLIGIAVRNPYDLLAFPELRTYLATYEYTPPALEAATRVLFGEISPRGRLPVSLPGLYPRGHGATPGHDGA